MLSEFVLSDLINRQKAVYSMNKRGTGISSYCSNSNWNNESRQDVSLVYYSVTNPETNFMNDKTVCRIYSVFSICIKISEYFF